ncbi:glycosyltransferase family 39 protein [Thermodesulfobacteriota bacterium]
MVKVDTRYIRWGILGIILLLGAFLRLQLISDTEVSYPLRADAGHYYFSALNMKVFGIYSADRVLLKPGNKVLPQPDCRRPPGYPLFLTPFVTYPPTSSMLANILLAQVFLGVMTILGTFLFMRCCTGVIISMGTALLVALSPHLVASGVYVLTETLSACTLVFFAWSVMKFQNRYSPYWALTMGLLLALSTMVRFTTLYFLILLIPFIFCSLPRKKAALSLMIVLGFMIIYGPWVARNKIVLSNSPGTSLAQDTVHKGMYPWLKYKGDPRTFGYPNRVDPEWETFHDMKSVLSEIRRRFMENPQQYSLWYLVGKPYYFLSWDMIVGVGDVFIYPLLKNGYETNVFLKAGHGMMRILHWPIIIASLLSMLLIWVPNISKNISPRLLFGGRFLSLLYGYFILVHVVGTPLPRYSVPLRPIIYSLALILPSLVHQGMSKPSQLSGDKKIPEG